MQTGTIHNRDKFLQTVANRLGRHQRTSGVSRPHWRHQPQWTVFQGYSQDELLEALKAQCPRIHTQCVETTAVELKETLKEVVAKHGGGPSVTWDDPRFDEYGLTAYCATNGRMKTLMSTFGTLLPAEKISTMPNRQTSVLHSVISRLPSQEQSCYLAEMEKGAPSASCQKRILPSSRKARSYRA